MKSTDHTVVLATRNQHKIQEIRALLEELPITFFSLADFPDLPEVVEDGATCQENAEKKSRETAVRTGFWALADDTGLEVVSLDNKNQTIGLGMIGELEAETNEIEFLNHIKSTFKSKFVRHSELLKRPVKKVAVLGGSGSFAIANAMAVSADIFVTSDLKYHDFFKSEEKIILADIGHFESEQFTKNLIVSYLTKKISNFAIILSKINTNPIKYF